MIKVDTGEKKMGKKRAGGRLMKIVATMSLPAVNRPNADRANADRANADRWNTARSYQKSQP